MERKGKIIGTASDTKPGDKIAIQPQNPQNRLGREWYGAEDAEMFDVVVGQEKPGKQPNNSSVRVKIHGSIAGNTSVVFIDKNPYLR